MANFNKYSKHALAAVGLFSLSAAASAQATLTDFATDLDGYVTVVTTIGLAALSVFAVIKGIQWAKQSAK